MFKTLFAASLLMLGASVAVAQSEDPASGDGSINADSSVSAKPADNAATEVDVQATAKEDSATADTTVNVANDKVATEDDADAKARAKKAKRKAECLAINVGKPRDC